MRIILFLLLCYAVSFAQEYRQIYGTSGSTGGVTSSTEHQNRSIVGQPAVGDVSGGNFGSSSGFTAFSIAAGVIVDAPDGPLPLPQSFEFRQNYPNPFNPSTTMEFALPHDAQVRLIVFDVLGRQVTTLVNATLPAGNYRHDFQAPSSLASGLYFAVFDAGDFHSVRKMMLIK